MARMYSRKHGKSRSRRPVRKTVPKWVRHKPEEVEKLVLKLAREGHSSAAVGSTLRDEYGIPNVREVTGKSVTQIMREHALYPKIPEDLFSMMRRAVRIMEHLAKHRHDPFAIRGLEITESKIRRLGKYYVRRGVLQKDWYYDREQAKLLVK